MRPTFLTALLGVVWGLSLGCGGEDLSVGVGVASATSGGSQEASQEASQGATGAPRVRLLYAKAATDCGGGPCYPPQGYLYGTVEVNNVAYEKSVVAHFTRRDSGVWQDAVAEHVGPTSPGWEAWTFRTPSETFPPRLSIDYQFALRYSVAGQTVWDSNGGNDFRVGVGPRPIYPRVALGAVPVVLNWAKAQGGGLVIDIALRNIAYHKQVDVVYSTDGWATVQQAAAGYMNSSWGALDYGDAVGYEHWGVDVPLPAGAQEVVFAIRYVVAGQTYWDNNLGRDYTLAVPGEIQ